MSTSTSNTSNNHGDTYDVIIVGAGIAGSIIARELGVAGKRVLVIEGGPEQPTEPDKKYLQTFYTSNAKLPEAPYPPKQFADPAREAVPRATVAATFPSNITAGYPGNLGSDGYIYKPEESYLLQKGPLPFASTYERVAGGTTWHWLGTSLRFLQNDFRMNSEYSVQQDWPLSVDDLTDDYGRAEHEIGVAADIAEQQGELLGTRYSSGYSYPLQPLRRSMVDQAVQSAVDGQFFDPAQEYPTQVNETPAGRNSQPYANRPICAGNTNCIPICPIRAKYDATVTLGEARKHSNVHFIHQSVVKKVLVDNSGRVSGVQYIPWTKEGGAVIPGSPRTVHGTIVVLAAHALETPKLLLMSADPSRGDLAHGVANSSGLVGCNLMDHPLYLSWSLARDPLYGFRGPLSTSGIETLRDGSFRSQRAAWRVEIGNEGWNFSANDPWTSTLDMIGGTNNGQLNPGQDHLFGDDLVNSLNHNFIRQWRMGFLVEQTPERTNRITLSDSHHDALGLPRPVIHYDLSDYTKLGFVHAEIFARKVYQLMDARCYTQNPRRVPRGGPNDMVSNPMWFPLKPEWRHFFENLGPLNNPRYTNLPASSQGVPQGFQYFGAGHIVGTCAMGSSRTNSVVDNNQRSWDHHNLYIVGSSVFPTVTTANPTLTIAALAFRAARAIKTALQ